MKHKQSSDTRPVHQKVAGEFEFKKRVVRTKNQFCGSLRITVRSEKSCNVASDVAPKSGMIPFANKSNPTSATKLREKLKYVWMNRIFGIFSLIKAQNISRHRKTRELNVCRNMAFSLRIKAHRDNSMRRALSRQTCRGAELAVKQLS
jgi:hypothetical protein